MYRYILALTLIAGVSTQAIAIDGYKDLKFGSDVKVLKASKICKIQKLPDPKSSFDTYYCEDFKFAGKNTLALFFVINGKFERMSIDLSNTNVGAVSKALREKHGSPSSSSTQEEITAAKTSGNPVFIRYDNDTIVFRGQRNFNTQSDVFFLIYTSNDYDQKLEALEADKLSDDL